MVNSSNNTMVICPVCNGSQTIMLFVGKQCLQCNDCDAVFKATTPDHKKQFIVEQGNETSSIRNRVGKAIIGKRFWEIVAQQYVSYLKQKTTMKFKTALDVGALYGQFVSKLNDIKINTTGIEANKTYVKDSVTNRIQLGYFDENYPIDAKYDLVCLTQMIYYVRNPLGVLEHTKKLLTPEGIIFISTQNPSSSIIKMKKFPEIIESGMNILLSKKNFASLQEKIGLQLIDYTTYRPEIYLQRFSGKTYKDELFNYMKFHCKKPYLLDPDGHHAFLLLKPL